jgi:hypothetical protein
MGILPAVVLVWEWAVKLNKIMHLEALPKTKVLIMFS